MAIELFKLVGSIMVNNDEANKSISKTEKNAEGVGDKLKSGIKTAAKWGAGVAVAAGTAITGMTKMAKSTAAHADEIDKMSQKLGMSKEGYQEWDYVLSQSGMEIGSLQAGMKKMSNSIDDAKNGSASAIEQFTKLGISVNDLNNLSTEELFNKAVQGMQGMEDGATRAALANDLFGKSGQNLTPLFNSSAESTENLKNKAHELGMVMSDESVGAGVKMTDTYDTMKRSLEGAKNQIGSALMPVVTEMFSLIILMMPTIKNLFATLAPVFKSVFSALLPPITELINSLLPLIPPLIEAIMPVINMVVKVVKKLIPLISTGLAVAIKALTPIISGLAKVAQRVFGSLIGFIKPPINAIIKAVNTVINSMNKLKIPDWVPGFGGKGLHLPTFKLLRVGIDYVPNDNYPALLHEGEAVLTKQQAYEWRNGKSGSNDDIVYVINLLIELLPSLIAEGIAGTEWSVNKREIARLVKKNA